VFQNVNRSDEVLDELRVWVVEYQISVDMDTDRDGKAGIDEPGKANWVWGEGQPGAIVLVNNDRDRSDVQPNEGEFSELADLLVRPTGLDNPDLNLYATEDDARRFSVYRKRDDGTLERILGRSPERNDAPITWSPSLSPEGEHCLIRGTRVPWPVL
jgi:hypothetical protein